MPKRFVLPSAEEFQQRIKERVETVDLSILIQRENPAIHGGEDVTEEVTQLVQDARSADR